MTFNSPPAATGDCTIGQYAEEGIIEVKVEVNHYNACPECKTSVKNEEFCSRCKQSVTPVKMPRCEVMLNRNDDYIPVTLFKSQISALLPDSIDETSDNTNLTEKLMEKLPAAIQFTKSPKKHNISNPTTSLSKMRLVQSSM